MAQLEYALLAEYARLDAAGLLTVVGGHFDRVQTPTPGRVYSFAVTFRVRLEDAERSVPFEIKVSPPSDQGGALALSGTAQVSPTAEVGGHYSQTVVNLGMPILVAGRYTVRVYVADELAKELPFEVTFTESVAG